MVSVLRKKTHERMKAYCTPIRPGLGVGGGGSWWDNNITVVFPHRIQSTLSKTDTFGTGTSCAS